MNPYLAASKQLRRSASESIAQMCLELGKGHFNWVQVGRIGWQKEQPYSCGADGLLCCLALMDGEIVENDAVAGNQYCGRISLFSSIDASVDPTSSKGAAGRTNPSLYMR